MGRSARPSLVKILLWGLIGHWAFPLEMAHSATFKTSSIVPIARGGVWPWAFALEMAHSATPKTSSIISIIGSPTETLRLTYVRVHRRLVGIPTIDERIIPSPSGAPSVGVSP